MASSDAKKGDSRAFGTTAILLPVPEGVDTDPQGCREVHLGQSHKTAESFHILAGFESTRNQSPADRPRECALELLFGELRDLSHRNLPM